MEADLKRKRLLVTLGVIAIALAGLAALLHFAPRRVAIPSSERRVAATIFPLYDIVRNVAGDAVQTELILPPSAEPHTFEPSPSMLRAIQGSAAIYGIGHGLDVWMGQIAGQIPVVTVDQRISLRKTGEENAGPAADGDFDPHYWLSVPNAKQIARNVADDLNRRFPDDRDTFEANLSAYLEKLEATDRQIRIELSGLKNRNLITLHDAWYYFAGEYGLTVAGTFEPTAGREPTPQWLAELKTAARRSGATALYREPQFDSQAISTFAADNGLKLVVLDDIGGTPDRPSYVDLMLINAHAISQNQP